MWAQTSVESQRIVTSPLHRAACCFFGATWYMAVSFSQKSSLVRHSVPVSLKMTSLAGSDFQPSALSSLVFSSNPYHGCSLTNNYLLLVISGAGRVCLLSWDGTGYCTSSMFAEPSVCWHSQVLVCFAITYRCLLNNCLKGVMDWQGSLCFEKFPKVHGGFILAKVKSRPPFSSCQLENDVTRWFGFPALGSFESRLQFQSLPRLLIDQQLPSSCDQRKTRVLSFVATR